MSGQTVQAQIRLLLIRVYNVCISLCIFWIHYSKEKPSCSTFKVITANFRLSEILGILWYRGALMLYDENCNDNEDDRDDDEGMMIVWFSGSV